MNDMASDQEDKVVAELDVQLCNTVLGDKTQVRLILCHQSLNLKAIRICCNLISPMQVPRGQE